MDTGAVKNRKKSRTGLTAAHTAEHKANASVGALQKLGQQRPSTDKFKKKSSQRQSMQLV